VTDFARTIFVLQKGQGARYALAEPDSQIDQEKLLL
jgi:hypothetical protein